MIDQRIELPQGTPDLLILKTLALEPQHGGAVAERVQQISRVTRHGWTRRQLCVTNDGKGVKYCQELRHCLG